MLKEFFKPALEQLKDEERWVAFMVICLVLSMALSLWVVFNLF